MIYTLLILMPDTKSSETAEKFAKETIKKAFNKTNLPFNLEEISHFYPVPYDHPFEPDHIPPYLAISPRNIPSMHDGYCYIKTSAEIHDHAGFLDVLNNLALSINNAFFFKISEGADNKKTIESFLVDKVKEFPNIQAKNMYLKIYDLMKVGFEARPELAQMLNTHFPQNRCH